MNVFAHYFKSTDTDNEYRWRTLLQFGNSWEIIGSVIMKNPGSATPLKIVEDEDLLSHLHSFCSEYKWYVFTGDNTMHNIEKLFHIYYETRHGQSNLNGVIQIFNLMNVCDPNLEMALIKDKSQTLPFSRTLDKDMKQLKSPVYLGWGNLKNHPFFHEDAEKLFRYVYEMMDGKYLRTNFAENLFYHPQYLMWRGKKNPKSQHLLMAFCQNIEEPLF